MNFRPAPPRDDPEMNLIPLIDVLLVILIFLAASTSFTQMRQLQIALPEASAQALEDDRPISLAISQEGLYALNGEYVGADGDEVLAQALRKAAQGRDMPTLRINADAQATHAAVVRALEAARLAGIARVHFTTQARP
ncbi:ExbD/TolR family protein [Castellaniella sp. S9]|uniref:ExbD/TolR family protein n=1 Tax=Castellaniella sp. S9 TaxID=2993652 RepID=UPI0022B2E8F6|nr:biopolymer transporter ExbD [Castellaniella sp. S9]